MLCWPQQSFTYYGASWPHYKAGRGCIQHGKLKRSARTAEDRLYWQPGTCAYLTAVLHLQPVKTPTRAVHQSSTGLILIRETKFMNDIILIISPSSLPAIDEKLHAWCQRCRRAHAACLHPSFSAAPRLDDMIKAPVGS